MRARFMAALAGLLLAAVLMAAAQDASLTKEPPYLIVQLRDGSNLMVTIPQQSVAITTDYGDLVVPVGEIEQVDFGIHYPPGLKEKIEGSIKNLGNDVHKTREVAAKHLQDKKIDYLVFPLLKKATENQEDTEISRRLALAIEHIQERAPPELLSLSEEDVVYAAKFSIKGRLKGVTLKVTSDHLDDVSLKFSSLCRITRANDRQKEFTVEAAKHTSPDEWLNTNITFKKNMRLVATTDGLVNIYPQDPGKYVVTAKGYSSAGKGGQFMAGALIGKIGEQGKVFFMGEHHDSTPLEEGKLFLSVVPSPWNNPSSGSYRVRIAAKYAPAR